MIRLALLTAHYRQPLDFTRDKLKDSRAQLHRLYGALRGIDVSDEARTAAEPSAALIEALEDDLNTPKAMAEMFAMAKALNKTTDVAERQRLASTMMASGDLMGLLQSDPESWFVVDVDGQFSADAIGILIDKRNEARATKDFKAADAYRDQLTDAGIKIEDGVDGTSWRRIG